MVQLTLDLALDRPRLSRLADLVYEVMLDGQWLTLGEIRQAINAGSEAGISARLRELHGEGRLKYQKRRRGNGQRGLWEYRAI